MAGGLYRWCVRPLLFAADAERVHVATLRAAGLLGRSVAGRALIAGLYGYDDPRLRIRIGGLDFPNPVALPAGFDKNGVAPEALAALGFGAIDIGSVSARPSSGNPVRPRLHRLPADEGIAVFYGVPNDGAAVVAARLSGVRLPVPLGISLVETNTGTPAGVDEVIEELVAAARPFLPLTDYLALNLNCPNSAGGFSHFDDPAHLHRLLQALGELDGLGPVFVRVSPPADAAGIDAVLQALDPFGFVKGLSFYDPRFDVRCLLKTPAAELAAKRGSVSAPVALTHTQALVREWYRRIDRRRLALIGVGGITTAEDAYRTIRLGASLVQVYTALVYQGPGVVREIKRGLAQRLARDGFASVADAVGVDNRAAVPR
ncbi:MAG: dihydroorotate dehydrogenase (quinone) [Rubrivivax sp.]|nr:dihydroorotate dehydrogenase (quinone) [Rubrivivax sp.]